jgi:hypothetical protein
MTCVGASAGTNGCIVRHVQTNRTISETAGMIAHIHSSAVRPRASALRIPRAVERRMKICAISVAPVASQKRISGKGAAMGERYCG